ncbi:MAG: hypothetical protein ACON4Z_01960 [Planctomycetota bacterium]
MTKQQDWRKWGADFVEKHRAKHEGKSPALDDVRAAWNKYVAKFGKTGRFRATWYSELLGLEDPVGDTFEAALASAKSALKAVGEAHKRSKAAHKATSTRARSGSPDLSSMSATELADLLGKVQRALTKRLKDS